METNRKSGIIIKGIGGFYYVKAEADLDADAAEDARADLEAAAANTERDRTKDNGPEAKASGVPVYECRARGIFRKEGITPSVGDRVRFSITSPQDRKGMVEEILPRKNVFVRPPIANVDCLITVIAAARPAPNLRILDQFLVMAEQKDAEVIVCVNKADLAEAGFLDGMWEIYQPLYPLVFTSGKDGSGVDELAGLIRGRTCALSGPSGVGKSTLLNRLIAGQEDEGEGEGLQGDGWSEGGRERMATGEVSGKTKRGRHTTRHVELFETDGGGMIFDTPGFTSFDILETEEDELQECYPELRPYLGRCRYDDCRHLREPDCAVREALAEGKVHLSRYESYCAQMKEIRERSRY